MAAGRPAGLAVVVLLACAAAPPILSPPVGANDDALDWLKRHPWCSRDGCECVAIIGSAAAADDGRQQQVSINCSFSGEKNVIWNHNGGDKWPGLIKSLVSVELNGDGRCSLTVHGKPFAAFERLRSVGAFGFAEVTVGENGLQVPNGADANFAVTVGRTGRVNLTAGAVRTMAGTVDVTLTDCGWARLGGEVVSKLRAFVLRRIGRLELAENAFRNAAEKTSIERVLLESLTADKLPSHAFKTAIDQLSITNCTFGTIEGNAFPRYRMENATFTNVTVDLVESHAFHNTLIITNLRMIECSVGVLAKDAITSSVTSIHIEHSRFGTVHTSAVFVQANELTLNDNTFELVDRRAFVLNGLHSVRVDNNTFVELRPEAFYEPPTAARQTRVSLLVRGNVFRQPADAPWSPAVRLQGPADETDVAGNRFLGRCGCGPWLFVVAAAGEDAGVGGGGGSDAAFADRNYCRLDATAAACANLTAADRDVRIDEFVGAARCRGDAAAYGECVAARGRAALQRDDGSTATATGRWIPSWERGVVTTVVLLILCGFGVVCAVSAITWLNARGYFIKLRTLLTSRDRDGSTGSGRDGDRSAGRSMTRTVSAHSLKPVAVHEYAEIRPGRRVIIYQDKGTQTVPEELTHEMLQMLRDKLDDPDDYPEARGMIEHLYDLIRVEESGCGGGGGGTGGRSWYSSGGLDDMVSTITTKAVSVDPDGRGGGARDVVSVGTGAPSLDKLWPPRMGGGSGGYASYRRPLQPSRGSTSSDGPGRPPSVGDEYADPADMLPCADDGGDSCPGDDGADTDIYCDLDELRVDAAAAASTAAVDGDRRGRPQKPPPTPAPRKPTEV